MRSFTSPFGAHRMAYAAIDPSIISSAITAGGAIAQTSIAAASASASKKKKKKTPAPVAAAEEVAAAPAPTSGGMPSWALYAGLGVLVLVGGFLLLRKQSEVKK